MDPFALQQEARKRTSWLVVLATVAVAATIAVTGFVLTVASWALWLAFVDRGDFMADSRASGIAEFTSRHPGILMACFAIAAIVILSRWLSSYMSLSSGEALMKEMGAKRIVRRKLPYEDDANASRLRLFNVCEEMSIAAGLDMPSVWLLEDVPGVNALAAGTAPSSAAVCVTRGALDNLTRDELQGVIAHEFSHILNGDMRLNMRITALITGITAVARMGRGMLSLFDSRSGSNAVRWSGGGSSRGGKRGGGGLAFIVIYFGTAIALWLVGSIGAFFARLVQCAVSRQREFLADASAAQFTRNPEALAKALRFASLADAIRGGRNFEAWKEDVSHMLFSGGVEHIFATHPPIDERIRRICPRGIEGDASLKSRVAKIISDRRARGREYERRLAEGVARSKALKAAVATLADAPLQYSVISAVRDPAKAGDILIGLLRGRAPEGWEGPLTASARRTLALRCVNTLRDGAPPSERRRWASEATRVVQEDGVYDSFEMMVMASVRRRLLDGDKGVRIVPARTLLPQAARIISTVALFGRDPASGYAAAEGKLSLFGAGLPPMPEPYSDAEELLSALKALVALPPLAKRELLTGLRETVAQDGVVSDDESNYLAAVADAIGAYGWGQMQVKTNVGAKK